MDSCNYNRWDNWAVEVAITVCNKGIRPGERSKEDICFH